MYGFSSPPALMIKIIFTNKSMAIILGRFYSLSSKNEEIITVDKSGKKYFDFLWNM